MVEPIVGIMGILGLGTILTGELLSGDVWERRIAGIKTRKDNPFYYWTAITIKVIAICIIIWNIDKQKIIESNIGYKAGMVIIIISWACVVAVIEFYLKELKGEKQD